MENAKSLIQSGKKHFEEREYEEALKVFQDCIKLLADSGDANENVSQQVCCIYNMGNIFTYMGEWVKSKSCFQRGVELARKINDNNNLLRCLIGKGEVHDALGEKDEAMECFKECGGISRDLGGVNFEAKSYQLLGLIYSKEGNDDQAMEMLNKAVDTLKKQMGMDDDTVETMAGSFNQMGLLCFKKADWENAKRHYSESIRLLEDSQVSLYKAEAYRYMGIIHSTNGDNISALKAHIEALSIYKRVKYQQGLAKIYNSIGQTYLDLENLDRSIFFLKNAAQIYMKLKSKRDMAMIYSKLGNVYKLMGNYNLAIQYYQKDLKLSLELGNERGLAYTYMNLGRVYLLSNEFETVDTYLRKSGELFLKFNDLRNLVNVYLDLGYANLYLDELEDALSYSSQAFELLNQTNRLDQVGKVHILNAMIKMKEGNSKESYELFEDAVSDLKETNYHSEYVRACFEYAKALYENNELSEAFNKFKKAYQISEEFGISSMSKNILEFLEKIDEEEVIRISISQLEQLRN